MMKFLIISTIEEIMFTAEIIYHIISKSCIYWGTCEHIFIFTVNQLSSAL